MASYNELNALIDAYINRNGVQAITGQILNGVLKAMVEQLGRGYTIMGAAIPTTDPGTPDGPECYFASTPGTYTDFDGLQVVPGELALLCYTPSDGWTKATIYEGFQEVQATIDGNVGTPSVGVSYANGVLSFDFHNMKGNPGQNGQDGQDGAAAGFGTIGADITGGVGTPGVSVESSGPATAKNLQFHFTNLKGETGVTSVVATVDNTTGTPACTVSLVGQQLTLAFSGLKGAQGDTGSSVDYPFTIVNNLTTDDATQALSAAQGVVLEGEITQLEAEVNEKADKSDFVVVTTTEESYKSEDYTSIPFVINASDTWATVSTSIGCRYRAVRAGQKVTITANANRPTSWGFLASEPSNIVAGDTAVFADSTGLRFLSAGQTEEVIVPVDCYLYVRYRTENTNANYFPSSIIITTYTTESKIEEWDNNTQEIAELQKKEIPTATGNNLFDWRNAQYGAVDTNGRIGTNQDYWNTDYIPIDTTIDTRILVSHSMFRVALYDENKVFLSYIGGSSLRTALDVTGASFIVACFAVSSIALESANMVFVGYGNRSDVANTARGIDGRKISFFDKQFFTISDFAQFASDKEAMAFTSDFSLIVEKGNLGAKNMIVTADAKFVNDIDNAVPTIKFTYCYRYGQSNMYTSMEYTIGARDYYEEKQWRIPPFPHFCYLLISVTIPANVTLYLRGLDNSFDNGINRNVPAYIFDGHVNGNVLSGFARIAKLGYPSCITIPKRTSDGVWVCFHDEVIGSQLKDSNGNTPAQNHPEIQGDVGIWDLTFAELQTYTYAENYDGTKNKVPTLEEYFCICARTGMRPMLSVHPTPTQAEYQEIKALAIKCGVLSQLELKPVVTGEGVAFSVFGNDISAYILQANTISATSAITRLDAMGADKTKVRVGAEYFGDSAKLTEQGVSDLISAGYVVSVYGSSFTAEDYKYWMSKGVTEFTDDGNASYGLNW